MQKVKQFEQGHVVMERLEASGMYLVEAYTSAGRIERNRCDDYRIAREYFRAFCAIVKARG